MSKLTALIDLAWMHPFAAAVIVLAAIFALAVAFAVGVVHWRNVWHRPMMRLPPPKDR